MQDKRIILIHVHFKLSHRQRPYVKSGYLHDLITHLRQLQLPGYKAGVQDKLPPAVHALFASDPSLVQIQDGGGLFALLVKEVSQVSRIA